MLSQTHHYSLKLWALALSVCLQLWVYFTTIDSSVNAYRDHHYLLLLILLSLLAIVNQLDLKIRTFLQSSDTPVPLDQEGIKILNEQANLGIKLVHDETFSPQLIELEKLTPEDSKYIRSLLTKPQQYLGRLSTQLRPTDSLSFLQLEDYAECRVLAHLPEINGRLQVGLFATQPIPAQAIFLWKSDVALVSKRTQNLFGATEQINQRPLTVDQKVNAIQSGGPILRSNPITLINFSWCHTDSVDAQSSPYLILPPHDLGTANCHFASVQTQVTEELNLCSAIISHKSIYPGEQLLAYSGSGHNAMVISIRRLLSKTLALITPALIIWPWLKLYQSLN